jgi:methyl-accepting chemotaxis protein
MFGFGKASADAEMTLAAIDRSNAVIAFNLDGIVQEANQNFLDTLGYTLDEIKGKHHRMFVEDSYARSDEYRRFWDDLRHGKFQAAQFKRIGKGGREVWIEASYNPILDQNGKPYKVVKFARDVTASKLEYADMLSQVAAINKVQAVISFNLDGIVQEANQNFLDVLGYSLSEIKGKHHRMFVEDSYARSDEYRRFWDELRQGKYQAAQFKRIGKGGREVWIEASYNPILDLNGKPFKVVKYATNVTGQVKLLRDLKQIVDRNFGEIDTALGRSHSQSQTASRAVQTTLSDVQVMAASAEELAASVREIADTVNKSKQSVEVAHDEVANADKAIRQLTVVSTSMDGIVGLIRQIAGQINLLALNATIESARAGEAGKGFAVVASEVKNLAKQAADATDRIAAEISGLQSVSQDVVGALGTISTAINAVLGFAAGIAGAVEEQTMVAQEMSAAMQRTASSVTAINDNMSEISASVGQVEHAVGDTRQAAQVLVR